MEHKSLAGQLDATLNNTDWSDATVVVPDKKTSIVHSTRLPAEYSEALETEAARRGISPSKLMANYVIAALETASGGDVITIPRQRLHDLLDDALGGAA